MHHGLRCIRGKFKMEDSDFYEVEAIVDKRKRGRITEYKVKWLGYGDEEDSWEPAANLTACQDLIDQFNESQMTKNASRKTLKNRNGTMKNDSSEETTESMRPLPKRNSQERDDRIHRSADSTNTESKRIVETTHSLSAVCIFYRILRMIIVACLVIFSVLYYSEIEKYAKALKHKYLD